MGGRLVVLMNILYLACAGMHWRVNDNTGEIELLYSNQDSFGSSYSPDAQDAARGSGPEQFVESVGIPLGGGQPLVAPPDTSSWYTNGAPGMNMKTAGAQWTAPAVGLQGGAGGAPAKAKPKRHHPEPALAVLFERYGGVDKALALLERSTALNPKDPVLWSDLGNAHRVFGDTDEAILCFENALRLQPHPDFFLNLGGVRFVLGELDEAIRLFTLGLQMNPRHVLLQFSMGNAFAVLGRKEEAARSFEATLRIQPDFAAAEQYLRNLRRELQQKWWPTSTLWLGGTIFVVFVICVQRTVHVILVKC